MPLLKGAHAPGSKPRASSLQTQFRLPWCDFVKMLTLLLPREEGLPWRVELNAEGVAQERKFILEIVSEALRGEE